MDLARIGALIELVAAAPIAELEVEEGPLRVRIVKGAPTPAPPAPAVPPAQVSAPVEADADAVRAPMTGTFYRAPSPEAAPFVRVGDRVEAGQTLGLVEAMKTLVKVEAGRGGVVRAVLAGNAEPVEEGQPLLALA